MSHCHQVALKEFAQRPAEWLRGAVVNTLHPNHTMMPLAADTLADARADRNPACRPSPGRMGARAVEADG